MPVVENKVVPMERSAEKMDAGHRRADDVATGTHKSGKKESIARDDSSKNQSGSGPKDVEVNVDFNFKDEFHKVWELLTYSNFKLAMVWFLDSANIRFSISVDDVMMLMTFYVLFIGDIKIMAVDKEQDGAVEIVTTICLFSFIFELVASSWSKSNLISLQPFKYEGYVFSFFFWLDVIAILSMFPDINWIAEGLGIGGLANDVGGTNSSFSQAARVVRTVRLVRLVRVYKITAERRRLKKINDELLVLLEEGAITYDQMLSHQHSNKQNKQSKVGAELSDTTTRRVILIVLAMLCLVPVLSYNEPDVTQFASTKILHDFNVRASSNDGRQLALDNYLSEFNRYYNTWYLLRLDYSPLVTGTVVDHRDKLNNLRDSTITKFKFTSDGFETEAWFNNYATLYNTAVGSILLILFVTFVMLVATVTFTADAQRLVLDPIERMMTMVEAVAMDPLRPLVFDHHEGSGEFETRLLESTIEKITGLLRIGFGVAGALIISENLAIEKNSSVIDPLIPGVRVYAIFGFCDIHHFEDVNEKLGKEIMSFVNTVAAIVHSKVNSWAGQCNKNLGNAFLVVWRIGDAKSITEMLEANAVNDKNGGKHSPSKKMKGPVVKLKEIDLTRVSGVDVLADRALVAYLKIIAEINRSLAVLAYRKDTRLTNNGEKSFKIRMGFGLHAGWAIEGAVGSLQKVDATYLSPHVNMAARLETSSKQYGVPLLFSERLYELLSPPAKKRCRKLDIVTVKGSEVPIGVYTYDCLQDQVFPKTRHAMSNKQKAAHDSYQRGEDNSGSGDKMVKASNVEAQSSATAADAGPPIARVDSVAHDENVISAPKSNTSTSIDAGVTAAQRMGHYKFCTMAYDSLEIFELDADLLALRSHVTPEFEHIFLQAVDLYIAGDWANARPLFERANQLMLVAAPSLKGDGPSKTLLRYMEAHSWSSSSIGWKGYRPLTSK